MISAPTSKEPRILLVDDDFATRQIVRLLSQKFGYKVDECDSAEAAMSQMDAVGSCVYDVVLSDYWMPGENGLELMKSISREDSALSVVLMTADEEREILETLIRHGGCGFVRKPLHPEELRRSLEEACKRTSHLRTLGEVETEARALGESQRSLMLRHLSLTWPKLEMYFTSKSQASGDFVSVIPLGGNRKLLVVSDGSGHDLSSAFQSNYFHGLARGMLTAGQPIEEVFEYFNELMLSEWNNEATWRLSISVCALDFDCDGMTVGCVNAGFPRPMVSNVDGFARPLGDDVAAPPLGWFSGNYEVDSHQMEVGCYYLWSDGLTDHANFLKIDPLSLAHRVLTNTQADSKLVKAAHDDIAVVRIIDPCECGGAVTRLPIVSASIPGDHVGKIDEWQSYFDRSLRAALNRVDGEILSEVLICIREGLINALNHGCKQDPTINALVMISVCSKSGEIAVLIEDPGSGHDFDFKSHSDQLGQELIAEHRGMMIMESIPKSFEIRNGGRSVHMKFSLN